MKSTNYFTIQGWMVTDLGLSGNNLLLYAIIYGFSQDRKSKFQGSLSYCCSWIKASKPTVIKHLKELQNLGLIKKTINQKRKINQRDAANFYEACEIPLQAGSKETLQAGSKETLQAGSKETLHNINNTINIKNINNITPLPRKDILENVSSSKMVRTHSSKQYKQAAKNRKSKQYLPLALTLAKIIETNKNIKILQSPTKTLSWAAEFQTLIEKQGIDQSRITDALAWYEKNIGGEYIPVIESGKSFREKFTKLEDAIKRGKQTNKSKVTIGSLAGGKTSSIDFEKGTKVVYCNF